MPPTVWIGVWLSVFGYFCNIRYLWYTLSGRIDDAAPLSCIIHQFSLKHTFIIIVYYLIGNLVDFGDGLFIAG